jgi:hypothetical protein
MRRLLSILVLSLLLRSPQASNASAYGQNSYAQRYSNPADSEKADRFTESDDDIFSSTYERELLSRKIFKKSLPPLSRKEIISWSFKAAKANTLL